MINNIRIITMNEFHNIVTSEIYNQVSVNMRNRIISRVGVPLDQMTQGQFYWARIYLEDTDWRNGKIPDQTNLLNILGGHK